MHPRMLSTSAPHRHAVTGLSAPKQPPPGPFHNAHSMATIPVNPHKQKGQTDRFTSPCAWCRLHMGFHHDLGGLRGKGEFGGHAAGAAPCITQSPVLWGSPSSFLLTCNRHVCGSNMLAMPNAAVLCNLPGPQLLQQAFLKTPAPPATLVPKLFPRAMFRIQLQAHCSAASL